MAIVSCTSKFRFIIVYKIVVPNIKQRKIHYFFSSVMASDALAVGESQLGLNLDLMYC